MALKRLVARLTFRKPPPVVAVVRLAGVIGPFGPLRGGLNVTGLAQILQRAFTLRGRSAVALSINSPGGSAAQSALIHKRIRALADEKEVPVFAFVEDVAASGGYWLACAADEIHADENSILGSIGVISSGFGFAEAIERLGIERRIHAQGGKKSLLDPFLPEAPEELARLDVIQKEVHANFKSLVRARRGDKLTASDDELFSGEFWLGGRAVELGLADGIGELRQVMRERFGEQVLFRQIAPERGWLRRRMRLSEGFAPTGDWAGTLLSGLEARALWARFGL